jgi:hypothetical protein
MNRRSMTTTSRSASERSEAAAKRPGVSHEPKVYDHDEPEARPSGARRPRSGRE